MLCDSVHPSRLTSSFGEINFSFLSLALVGRYLSVVPADFMGAAYQNHLITWYSSFLNLATSAVPTKTGCGWLFFSGALKLQLFWVRLFSELSFFRRLDADE